MRRTKCTWCRHYVDVNRLALIDAATIDMRHFIMCLLLKHFELRKLVSFSLAHIVLRRRTQRAMQCGVHWLLDGACAPRSNR